MKLTFKVTMDDGTQFECATNLYTIVAWERKYKRKASDMANSVGIEDMAFLAHTAARDAGVTVPLMLDDFIKKAVAIDVIEQETINPIEGAHTVES